MDVTIQQLRMLREVSSRGTISAAAAHLGYTPSAVSQQLASAERGAGVALLERSGRNVLLTDAGRELVRHADLVLHQLDEAAASLERVASEVAGPLNIGFVESLKASMLRPLLEMLRTRHPELIVRATEIDGRAPLALVRSGELDVTFAIEDPLVPAPVEDDLERILVCRDWFRAVLPAEEFASGKPPAVIDVRTLASRPFAAPPAVDSCGRAMLALCRNAGFEPDRRHTVSDYPTTLCLVGAGGVVALVPDLGLQDIPDDVVVVDLESPGHRRVVMVHRSSGSERPAIRAFAAAVEEVADSLDLDRTDAGSPASTASGALV